MKAGDRYVMPCGTQIELMRFSESIQCWKCAVLFNGRVYMRNDDKGRGRRVSLMPEQLQRFQRI